MRYADVEREDATELRNLVADTPINQKIGLTPWRGGKRVRVRVVIQEPPG